MLVIKGDKIKQVNEIMGFNYVGKEFEVVGVDMGVISFSCSMGTGVMSYDELEKYFEKVVEVKWSEWEIDPANESLMYRVKDKLIELADINGDYNSVFAKCLPSDEFELEVGLDICRKKMEVKKLMRELKKY